MESAVRGWLAAGTLGAVLLVAPASALGAMVGVLPQKPCYRVADAPNSEKIFVAGGGFTPNGTVDVTLDRKSQGKALVNAQGQFAGTLPLAPIRGERKRSLAAIDQPNPGIFASLQLRMTGVSVGVSPRHAGPGRAVRIKARGFTGSRRLYAHVRRKRYRRNVGIGRLRGACRKLSRRKRIFSLGARPGVYKVQFDGKRRYSKKTTPRILYRVTIFRRAVRRRSVSTAAENWVPLP
jgi:hypothetical protein